MQYNLFLCIKYACLGEEMAKIVNEIKKLLEEEAINTQEDIKTALAQKGFKVMQSTISRNLKKLGVIKVIAQGETKYQLPPKHLSFTGLASFIKRIDHNGYMIIIQNHSGTANTVCEYIDRLQLDNIMGTVSGDNTVLVIPKDVSLTAELKKQLEKIFAGT